MRLGVAQGYPTGANLGDLTAARVSLAKALMMSSALVAADSTDRAARRTLALAHEKIGDVRAWTGDVSGAVVDAREALRHWRFLADAQPRSAGARLSLAISMTKLGDLLGHPAFPNLGDRVGAEIQYRGALALLEEPGLDSAAGRGSRRQIALSHERLGAMLQLDGRHDEALDAFERSLALREELSREDRSTADATRDVAVSRESLCRVQLDRGDLATAWGHCAKAVELYKGLHAADPGNAQGLSDLALAHGASSDVLAAEGRWTAALSELDRSTALLREFLRSNPGNHPAGRHLARNLLRSSILQARLAGAGPSDRRPHFREQSEMLYATGRRALVESLAQGTTVEDEADEALAREAAAQVARVRRGATTAQR